MQSNWEKIQPYLLVALLFLLLMSGGYILFLSNQYHERANQLTAQDARLQLMRNELGLAESKLVRAKELQNILHKDKKDMEEETRELIEEYNLKLKSKDVMIASLKGVIKKGTTKVVVQKGEDVPLHTLPCDPEYYTISYEWFDDHKRFHLQDPDIFEDGDETFTHTQHFRVTGHVFEAKNGQLQTRRVVVEEIIKTEEGWRAINKLEPQDIKFTYANRAVENQQPGLLDVITLRPYGLIDTSLSVGAGLELINLGRYIPWANFGLGPQLGFDISDPFGGSLQRSHIGLGTHYHLGPPILDTNFAIGASVGVPFNDLTSPMFTLYLTVYLTGDLNPLGFWKDRPSFLGVKL